MGPSVSFLLRVPPSDHLAPSTFHHSSPPPPPSLASPASLPKPGADSRPGTGPAHAQGRCRLSRWSEAPALSRGSVRRGCSAPPPARPLAPGPGVRLCKCKVGGSRLGRVSGRLREGCPCVTALEGASQRVSRRGARLSPHLLGPLAPAPLPCPEPGHTCPRPRPHLPRARPWLSLALGCRPLTLFRPRAPLRPASLSSAL